MASTTDRHAARMADIVEVARRQLSEVGPAALSLRSIARELDVVPSAVYRYVAGRDAILTALIIDAYDRLGDAVDAAADAVEAPRERWLAIWQATRAWAVEHPHEYALLYGTPVIGYAAPSDTIGPAMRVAVRLARTAIESGAVPPARSMDAETASDAQRVLDALPSMGIERPASPALVLAVLDAWSHMFGLISFELFGHFVGSLEHGEAAVERIASDWADRVDLPG